MVSYVTALGSGRRAAAARVYMLACHLCVQCFRVRSLLCTGLSHAIASTTRRNQCYSCRAHAHAHAGSSAPRAAPVQEGGRRAGQEQRGIRQDGISVRRAELLDGLPTLGLQRGTRCQQPLLLQCGGARRMERCRGYLVEAHANIKSSDGDGASQPAGAIGCEQMQCRRAEVVQCRNRGDQAPAWMKDLTISWFSRKRTYARGLERGTWSGKRNRASWSRKTGCIRDSTSAAVRATARTGAALESSGGQL